MTVPLVHDDPNHAGRRLAELGLTVADLHRAIRYGYLARLSCNANDPPSVAGILFWARTTRGLREHLAPMGWKKSDSKLSTTVNADETIALAVATGNDDTGLVGGEPKSRFAKGPATRDAVASNASQGELFPLDQVLRRPPITWILLVSVERLPGWTVIRSELSLPSAMDDEGRIGDWFERIVLPPIIDEDEDGGGRRSDGDAPPDIEVDVRRRTG